MLAAIPLQFPVTTQNFPGIAAESVEELDHDVVGGPARYIVYHVAVFFTKICNSFASPVGKPR